MSLNYARELLKISLSNLCCEIGFDCISEISMDILIEICEKEFENLFKQISNRNSNQLNFLQILFILFEKRNENLNQLNDYLIKFKSIQFSNDIIQFPYRKKNQFYLRIPPKDSQQILQRDQNQNTEYIYDWLPLFPDR